MSDGASDANRTGRKIEAVEEAADDLAEALLRTGDAMFRVHPQAVEYANEELKKTGYQLVKVKP